MQPDIPPGVHTSRIAGMERDGEPFWVFAYGSLMWRPGFDVIERLPARLSGAHRSFCVYSTHYRGTRECPGVVLGLDQGGSCRGFALRIPPGEYGSTYRYLTEREMLNQVYRERFYRVDLGAGHKVNALAYLVNRKHAQYTGRLPPERLLGLIEQGCGKQGPCRDYVLNTLDALASIGIEDHALSWLRPALSR